MGVIEKRTTTNGVSYRVKIRQSGNKTISKTFTKKANAHQWMTKTESDIERDVYREDEQLFGDIVRRYIVDVGKVKPFGRSKAYSLDFLRKELGHYRLKDLTVDVLYSWALERGDGIAPATVMMDMSYIGTVLKAAASRWKAKPKIADYDTVMEILKDDEVIAPSDERDRRISDKEFLKIFEHASTSLPLVDWTIFSLATAMRLGEVSELRWADLSSDGQSIIIRQRKHPKKKRDQTVPLLPAAQAIISNQQPEDSDRRVLIGKGKKRRWVKASDLIFPDNPKSITAAFRRARVSAGIYDVRYHDIRHEAISRLFDMGLDSMLVAVFSGHRDINMLKRYTHPDAASILAMVSSTTNTRSPQ